MSRLCLIAAASAATLLGVGACGHPAGTSSTDASATVERAPPASDTEYNVKLAQDFVNAAGQAQLVEIEASKLALEHAASPEVKAFAQMMIDDHSKAEEALRAAAAACALAPPSETLDDAHMRLVNDLNQERPGDSFDADYMRLQIDAHTDAIKRFGDYAKDGQIPQIQSFAEATLPTLDRHKANAESVNGALGKVKPS
jgi:putative membrane protein